MNNKIPNTTLYKRLLTYVKPYWLMVVFMLIATAVYASTNAIYVSQLATIIDEGFVQQSATAIYTTIGILVLVTLLRGVGFFISNYTSRRISSDIVLTLRQQMFAKLHRLPTRYFDKVSSGETLSRFNYDVLQVTDAATNAVVTMVREGTLVVVLLSYLLYQNWKLTLLIFILTPLIGLIVRIISKRLRELAKRIQGNMGDMNHILDENIKGQKIIKIYQGQTHENEKFNHAVRQIRHATIKSEVATSLSTPVIELLLVCVLAIIIGVMAQDVKAGHFTAGQFVAYIGMIAMLTSPIKKLMRINEFVQRGLAASDSIFTFLDELDETEPDTDTAPSASAQLVPKFSGELTFQHVNFSYGEERILNDFNLHIRAGETVALVGASGSGKSSLVSLIPRFYDIDSGSIKLDGIDIAEMDLALLRQQIAFVNQDTVLFNDSVTHNIAYGVATSKINHERVKSAAQLAHAESFIVKMEQGYDSFIGESGQRLSGGQKQRLSIARAIYKDAPILILDEATSALDSESEHQVQLALEELMQHRTAIVIAHRLSTVQNADRILVLDNGVIVESGTHEELMQAKGRYFHLGASMK